MSKEFEVDPGSEMIINSEKIIGSINDRIQKSAVLFWIRKKDGEPILSTGWYWLHNGRKKNKELDWYDSKRPYYSRYAKVKTFLRRHEFVGEL